MTEPTSASNSPPASVPPIVFYSIGVDHPITPDEPLPSLPQIPAVRWWSSKAEHPSGGTESRFTNCTAHPPERLLFLILDWERSSWQVIRRSSWTVRYSM